MDEEMYHYPVRDWYIENFPDDELGQMLPYTIGDSLAAMYFDGEIDDDSSFADNPITFETYWQVLERGGDVYQLMRSQDVSAGDSIIRERIFTMISEEILDIDYDVIYNMWMRADG